MLLSSKATDKNFMEVGIYTLVSLEMQTNWVFADSHGVTEYLYL